MQAIFGCFVRCRKLQVVHIQHGLKLSIYSPYSLPSHRKHQIHLHLYNTQFWCDDNLLALQKYRFVTSHTSYTYTRKQTHTQCGQYGMYIRTESRVILTRMSRCRQRILSFFVFVFCSSSELNTLPRTMAMTNRSSYFFFVFFLVLANGNHNYAEQKTYAIKYCSSGPASVPYQMTDDDNQHCAALPA